MTKLFKTYDCDIHIKPLKTYSSSLEIITID